MDDTSEAEVELAAETESAEEEDEAPVPKKRSSRKKKIESAEEEDESPASRKRSSRQNKTESAAATGPGALNALFPCHTREEWEDMENTNHTAGGKLPWMDGESV